MADGPRIDELLIDSWLPGLTGVHATLEDGGTVADVGCVFGVTTVSMARAYPESRFWGFDPDESSIEVAERRATDAAVGDRVRFEVASALDFPGAGFDLVCHLNGLRERGYADAVARHVRWVLAPAGSWLVVEAYAGNPGVDPTSAWTELDRLRRVAELAGFTRIRQVALSAFHVVVEAGL